jgi:hypothetical protein
MDLSAAVLGRPAVAYLIERQHSAVLTIGRDVFDRAALAHVECFNFTAAATLSRVLTKEIRAKDTRDVFDNVDPLRFALPRLGPVALAVLGAAFQANKIGSATPLLAWFEKHRGERRLITFSSIKAHDAKLAAASRASRPKRRA